MASLKIGDKAPDFCLPDKDGKQVCIKDFSGDWLVVYFYPRDNTPGCTVEACEFTEKYEEFESSKCPVIGISPDTFKSHEKFIQKFSLKHILLADDKHVVIDLYGQWVMKKMYGKESQGVNRSTFLVNPEGKIAFIWDKVKAKGHAEEVIMKIQELKKRLNELK